MELTENQRTRLIELLERHNPNGIVCAICGNRKWATHGHFFEVRDYNDGNLVMGGPVIPMAALECLSCGHVLFLNALRNGLLEDE